MDVALFIPCYVDQLAPEVGWATVRVLERAGCRVRYDPAQTCCGQPFLNAGAARPARRLARRHLARFAASDTSLCPIVCPSGSCVATVRRRFPELGLGEAGPDAEQRARTFELGEFLVQVLGRTELGARFPHRVALLQSCHGLRDLGLGAGEEGGPDAARPASPAETLLAAVDGLELLRPERPDECCGFGGAFSVRLPAVSARMGEDRLDALARTGAEYVTATDSSCLLHLGGLQQRRGAGPRPIHLAEILAAGEGP